MSPDSELKKKKEIKAQIRAIKQVLREKRRELIFLSYNKEKIDTATQKR